MGSPVPSEKVGQGILLIRGHRVMLDGDSVEFYLVPNKVINQAVKRNRARFPADFMFQLTQGEADALRSQIMTLKMRRGRHRQYRPYGLYRTGGGHALKRAAQ